MYSSRGKQYDSGRSEKKKKNVEERDNLLGFCSSDRIPNVVYHKIIERFESGMNKLQKIFGQFNPLLLFPFIFFFFSTFFRERNKRKGRMLETWTTLEKKYCKGIVLQTRIICFLSFIYFYYRCYCSWCWCYSGVHMKKVC